MERDVDESVGVGVDAWKCGAGGSPVAPAREQLTPGSYLTRVQAFTTKSHQQLHAVGIRLDGLAKRVQAGIKLVHLALHRRDVHRGTCRRRAGEEKCGWPMTWSVLMKV